MLGKKDYSKEKFVEYYAKNKIKEEKDKIKEHQRKRYQELVQYKKEMLKDNFCSLLSIKHD